MKCANQLIFNLKQQLQKKFKSRTNQPNIPAKIQDVINADENINRLDNKKKPFPSSQLKESLGISLLLGSVLFESYYLSTVAIVTGLGLGAALVPLSGPIGLSIALVVTILIAGYFGYQHYHYSKRKDVQEKEHKQHQKMLNQKYHLCNLLKDELSNHSKSRYNSPLLPEDINTKNHFGKFKIKKRSPINFGINTCLLFNNRSASKAKVILPARKFSKPNFKLN